MPLHGFLFNLFTLYLPILFLGYFMPDFIKRTLLFGVVIPEELNNNEEVLKIKKNYKRNYVLSTIAISTVLSILLVKAEEVDILIGQSENLLGLGVILLVMNMSLNYLYAHNQSKLLKEKRGWTNNKKQMVIVDTSHRQHQKYLSDGWFLIPFGIVIFTIAFTMIQYEHLPQQIPNHFDLYGNATKYVEKSFFSVFGLPFTQLGMIGLLFGVYRLVQRVKSNIQASRPKMSAKQNQVAKRYWAIYTLVISGVLSIQLAYIQLSILQIVDSKALVSILIQGISIFIPMAGAILVAIKTGQSGSRIKVEEQDEVNNKVIDRDDDQFWKFGMFYYNPDDPNLHVEKRFGIGWTINFGRPAGIAIMIILVIFIIGSILLSS